MSKDLSKIHCVGVCKDCELIWNKVKELETQINALQEQIFEMARTYESLTLRRR